MNTASPPLLNQPPPLWKTYLAILVPMMLTNTLQAAAGTIDGIYLGQMIGVEAIAAVSSFFPIFFFLLAIIIGLSSGATVLIGQAWGGGNHAKARAVAGTALALVLSAGLLVSIFGALLAPTLLTWLGTPANILADATIYARLMMIGAPLIFLLWLTTSMSRGVGDAVTPLWTLLLATLMGLVFTPAFIKGWGGLPQLGVASAAVSTMLAFAFALTWMSVYWRRKGHPLAPNVELLRHVRFDPVIARSILRIGIPSSLQMLTMAVAEIVLLGLVNRHGSDATAAYGAVTQVMSWMQLPALSIGITATILASHAIGANRSHRLGSITQTGLWLNVVVTGAFVGVAYGLSPVVIGLFLKDGSVVALALEQLHIVAWSVIVLGSVNVLIGVMRASGTVLGPAGLGVLAILCIELPAAYWLDAAIGISGIWWSYALAFVAMLVLQTTYFQLAWRRRSIQRLI
jgi:putative MATE family efflux protein